LRILSGVKCPEIYKTILISKHVILPLPLRLGQIIRRHSNLKFHQTGKWSVVVQLALRRAIAILTNQTYASIRCLCNEPWSEVSSAAGEVTLEKVSVDDSNWVMSTPCKENRVVALFKYEGARWNWALAKCVSAIWD